MNVKEHSEKMGQQLNIQKTKLMTMSKIVSLRTDKEDMEVVNNICLLGQLSTIKEPVAKKYITK